MEFPAKLLNKRKESVVSFVFNEKSQQVQASGQASLGAQPQDLSCDFLWGLGCHSNKNAQCGYHCALLAIYVVFRSFFNEGDQIRRW